MNFNRKWNWQSSQNIESTHLNMKKFLFLAIPACLSAFAASAQVELQLEELNRLHQMTLSAERSDNYQPATRTAGKSNDMIEKIEMLVHYDSAGTLADIEARGGEIVSELTDNIAIVSVSPMNAVNVAAASGVTNASLSRLVKMTNDQGRIFSKVNEVLKGEGLDQSYDGTGVIVGLFDVGVDPNHINFQDADGNSRVKLYLQYSGTSSSPTIYNTPTRIAAATTDDNTESHGTHVAGIMTGSYNKTSATLSKDYSGVAPGAEIVMAGGPGYTIQLSDAVRRIAQYAQQQGKPCVINLSFGDNMGPHDGSDPLAKTLNDIANNYDAVICMSSGNEGEDPISVIGQFPDDNPVVGTLIIAGSKKPTDATVFQGFGDIQVWGQDETPFEVTLDVVAISDPDNVLYSYKVPVGRAGYTYTGTRINSYVTTSSATLKKDEAGFKAYYTNSYMGGVCGVNPSNNRYYAQLTCFLEPISALIGGRNYVRITVKGTPGKKVFFYNNGTDSYMVSSAYSSIAFGNRGRDYFLNPDGNGTNSNMGSGPNTICVGSYVSRDGSIGDISSFSSWGETPDGRILPDVCTPGQVIVSSRNTYATSGYSNSGYVKVGSKTYYWTPMQGTSMASPHMAGICALWRQANPNLKYYDIQEIARTTAATPEFDSKGWGYGKADALAGIKKILNMASVYDIMDNGNQSILIEQTGKGVFEIFAGGENSVSATVYNLQGIAVTSVAANENTVTLDLANLPTGIYVIKASAPHANRTLKVSI